MKKEILEALKTKFEGVQESVLSRIAEKLAKTVTKEEDVATSIEGVTLQQIIDGYADSRVNEAAQTVIANYEKKHNLKDGKIIEKPETPAPATPEPATQTPDDAVPKWAKALMDSNKILAEKLASIEGEKVINNRKSVFETALKGLPDPIKTQKLKDFNRLTFTDDTDFENYIKELKDDSAQIIASGVVIAKPRSGNNPKPEDTPPKEVLNRIEKRKAEPVTPAIVGLPKQN
jgi:hypothetical protein